MKRDICVIYNPASGKGRGRARLERLHRALATRADFLPTAHPGHGEALALQATQDGVATIIAAGGDGTIHEVANGILRADRPEATLAVVPIGSANDYAHSLGLDNHWWQRREAAVGVRSVDVGVVRSATKSRYFVNGLGLGFNGAVNLEAAGLKRLQGVALYGAAVLRALWLHFDCPPLRIQMDNEPEQVGPTLALTLALGRREGNFVVAPNAQLADGLFDYLQAGQLTRWQAMRLLPALFRGHWPTNYPALHMGRCRRVQLASTSPLIVHLDGESFSLPEHNVQALEVELLQERLRVYANSATVLQRPAKTD